MWGSLGVEISVKTPVTFAPPLVRGFLAAGVFSAAGWSQPPGGDCTLTASSGCCCGVKVCDAERAAASEACIESGADVVALLAASRSPCSGREREPFVGFRQVLLDADAAGIEDAEIILAVGDAVFRRSAEPLRRGLVIRLAVDAFGVETARLCIALAWPFSAAIM